MKLQDVVCPFCFCVGSAWDAGPFIVCGNCTKAITPKPDDTPAPPSKCNCLQLNKVWCPEHGWGDNV